MAGRKQDLDKKFREELEAYKKWCEKCNEAAEKQYEEEQAERVFIDDEEF